MNNFSPRAQLTLALARKEANRLGHSYVSTEHVLLGLIKLGKGVAVNVLLNLGLDLETVRAEVEKQVGHGPDTKLSGNIPYTPRVKKALALAGKEAKAMDHGYVGSEHLLLGLLVEDDGVAAHVLKALGLDICRARAEVLKELDPKFSSEPNRITTQPSLHLQDMVDFNLRAKEETLRREETKHNFTPRAHQVLALARREAGRLNHNFVGTDHLLLGVIKLGQGVAVNVLGKLGLNLETVRIEVEKVMGSGSQSPEMKRLEAEIEDIRGRKEAAIVAHDFEKASALRDAEKEAKDKLEQVPGGQGLSSNIPFTPRVKNVLALAGEEAKALNHRYIGTEHILLALLREGTSPVLQALDVDLEKTRNAVLSELDPNFGLGKIGPPTAEEMNAKLQELNRRVEETAANLRLKNEGEDKPTRQELLKKLEDVLVALDSLKTDIIRLRADALKRNS